MKYLQGRSNKFTCERTPRQFFLTTINLTVLCFSSAFNLNAYQFMPFGMKNKLRKHLVKSLRLIDRVYRNAILLSKY